MGEEIERIKSEDQDDYAIILFNLELGTKWQPPQDLQRPHKLTRQHGQGKNSQGSTPKEKATGNE